jgi:hypothetical protein
MKTFQDIQEILDELVDNRSFGAHGAFWRTLSRDEFVEHRVFGYQIIKLGNPSESNIIKALKGLPPFNGVPFRSMPAGMDEATAIQIKTIEDWIENGCPEYSDEIVTRSINYSDDHHNTYWREFDDWAMFQATNETQIHEGKIMGELFPLWMQYMKSSTDNDYQNWINTIKEPSSLKSIKYLSKKQRATVEKYYNENDSSELMDSYEKFGKGSLLNDPLRPQDPEHKMNGPSMWAIWLCSVDATLRTKSDTPDFWYMMSKAILIGMTNDGVMRNRFPVLNYNSNTIIEAKSFILNIQNEDVLDEIKRFVLSTRLLG